VLKLHFSITKTFFYINFKGKFVILKANGSLSQPHVIEYTDRDACCLKQHVVVSNFGKHISKKQEQKCR